MPKGKEPQAASQKAVAASPKPPPGEIRKLKLAKGHTWPQVSSLGRFKSTKGVISTPKPKEKGGQVKVQITGNSYSTAAMILRAYHSPAPTPKHKALHWSLDNTDNRIENLKWATQKEILAHSRKMNPNHKSSASQLCKPIRGRKVKAINGSQDEDRSWKTYELGARQAAKELGLSQSTISECCTGKCNSTGGYEFEYYYDSKAEGEANEDFKKIPVGEGPYELRTELLDKIKNSKRKGVLYHPEISNFGRFRDTNGVVKIPLPGEQGYCRVGIMGEKFGVHGLVCRAFHGSPPIDMEDPTPDHYPDRDPSNNCVDNLRWATKREQTLNRDPDSESTGPRQSKPVKGRKLASGDEQEGAWVQYGSALHAANQINELNDGVTLYQGSISKCCRGEQIQTGGYEFKFDAEAAEPRVLLGEEWRDIIEIE